jgi:hypothetical protein
VLLDLALQQQIQSVVLLFAEIVLLLANLRL